MRLIDRGEKTESDLIRDGQLAPAPGKKIGGRKAHAKRQALRANK